MAVTARRTVANVKSSAMRPRQPEVPNLMGDAAVFGEALMGGYSTRAGSVLKDEDGMLRDAGEEKDLTQRVQRPEHEDHGGTS